MPNYRRYYIPGASIFITQVTYDRAKILDDPQNLALFWDTLKPFNPSIHFTWWRTP